MFSRGGRGKGHHILPWGRHGRVNSSVNSSLKSHATSGSILSPGDLVVIGANTPIARTLGVLMAAGNVSSREMPVVTAMINGQSVLCLVDMGSGCTMV